LAGRPVLLYEAARVLSSRLREADSRRIADLQRKNRELARAYRELQEAQASMVEKERLEHELDLARELQKSILPQVFPEVPGASCAARSRPARQVGGDFYDVFPLGADRLGLVMADVSDKGMSAALYMALTRSLIRAEAGHHASPRRVLLSTHRLLLEMTQADMFVTVFYGVLEPGSGTLRYTRAGHNYPLLFNPRSGECRALTGRGIVLGCVERVDLEEVSVDLHPGELLVLYTDGVTDANSTAGEFFGVERLREVVCATGQLSAQNVCDLVFERVDRFQAGAMQYDDMALLVVRMA
jgi:serine phosphatase RsbU (regulator of sigma subunit)